MLLMLFWLGLAVWYIIGVVIFIHAWTLKYDFTANEIVIAMASGIIGPLAFFACSHMYENEKVIFKARNKEER